MADDHTAVLTAPAPWQLRGRAYVSLLRFPDYAPERDRFVPDTLQDQRIRSPWGALMFVDYSHSDVGPYHELLYIPGAFPFADGNDHASITRIFVSSLDSVVNGRRNWGIPKDLAEFDVRYRAWGVEVEVSREGRRCASLAFRHYPLGLPVLGALVPGRLRGLGHHRDGKTFLCTPRASGLALLARCTRLKLEAAEFPEVPRERVAASVYLPAFRMRFPEAIVLPRL